MIHWYFTSGDSDFFWKEQLQSLSWMPHVFRQDLGFGLNTLLRFWFDYPFWLLLKLLSSVELSWFITEKILWLSVFFLAIYSSYRLAVYILGKSRFTILAPIIYAGNTYFLLLFCGGQLGVALAYAFSPWVLLKFIQYIDHQQDYSEKIKDPIQNGLWLALLVCFDLRFAYLVMGAVVLYLVLRIIHEYGQKAINNKQNMFSVYRLLPIFYTIVIPLFVAVMVHLFWILPSILASGGLSGLGEDFTNAGMLQFLSFADFSHALSLLHPNWPENLFGKVYFLQPEFLVLPILAFSALVWVGQKAISNKQNNEELRTKNQQLMLFFAFLALLGVFLAKGANPPFGGIFILLFEHVPGFIMFRDPTKFYLFITLGYSILIPYTISQISSYVLRHAYRQTGITNWKKEIGRYASSVIIILIFLIYWCFTIRAVFTGRVAGNFHPLVLTKDHIRLKDMLVADNKPYRTLWIPRADKFLYSSDVHPVLTSDTLWKNASIGALLTIIKSPDFYKLVESSGVRYIIVPQDLEKRIFLSDYRYDQTQRDALIETMLKTGLPRLPEFQELAIFENSAYTFKADIPEYVKKQEYWANVGLGVSVASLVVFISVCLMLKRNYGK